MDLDLKDFEWDRTDQNLEWWLYNTNHMDYYISLNKESLMKILDWEEVNTDLYWTWDWIDMRELEKWVGKELTFCLLSDEERSKNFTNALPVDNRKLSEKVKIKISKNLINSILSYEPNYRWESYEYRYDAWWNKMHFYVKDNHWKERLKDDIDFFRKIYNLTHPKKE